ncbi:MAG: MauE/DoxX family redox-associated membrane protein [Chlamydiota bacterium]
MQDLNKFRRYRPLLVLILIAALGATALCVGVKKNAFSWMHFFMGFFLCQFSMLKLFHPTGFVHGFQKYDLLAKRFFGYAYAYPFIELALGLAYLSFIFPVAVYIVTIVLMGIGTIGVTRALKAGLDIRCACMGTILDVPLSTVTLSEDISMGVMALGMLGMTLWERIA